ncbi:hypothetical protein B6U99_03500 [Candidatus Geothermarchaeota archaeon ex4572_27]|nr:MAG: hypothetical protein B6U99_03500 [Candidatus Geothermarchaeota archaeon ex4572_27]
MAGCAACGAPCEGALCESCLSRIRSMRCAVCGERLEDFVVEGGVLRHVCGMEYPLAFLARASSLDLEEELSRVCDEYGCEELEECALGCSRLREFMEGGPSKIRPILEPVLRGSGLEVEYGWKVCVAKDGGGVLAVLIDQHNPAYLSEGPSTASVEGPDKATIIGSKLTERQVALLGPIEEALRSHGYTDLLKVFIEEEVVGTTEAP